MIHQVKSFRRLVLSGHTGPNRTSSKPHGPFPRGRKVVCVCMYAKQLRNGSLRTRYYGSIRTVPFGYGLGFEK